MKAEEKNFLTLRSIKLYLTTEIKKWKIWISSMEFKGRLGGSVFYLNPETNS